MLENSRLCILCANSPRHKLWQVRLKTALFYSQAMRWTDEHDILLLREVLLCEPYKHEHGSTERGRVWEQIAETLNQIQQPVFRVSQRSVRDHFKTLYDNYKKTYQRGG